MLFDHQVYILSGHSTARHSFTLQGSALSTRIVADEGRTSTMLRPYRSQGLRALKRHSRAIVLVLLVSLFLLYKYGTDSSTIAREKRLKLTLQFEQAGHREDIYAPDDAPDDAHQDAGPQDAAPDPMSVHLVIAGTTSEDISWTSRIKIPGLEVIHYIADDPSAPYHPPANKGREAMIYHNYFYDFYDHLPDVAILTHAQDISWHMEPVLSNSLTFALSHLDLSAVKERGYANLRVSWENACPRSVPWKFRRRSWASRRGTGDLGSALLQSICRHEGHHSLRAT
jgi:hypothetical protein